MRRLYSVVAGIGVALLGLGAATAATISVVPPAQTVLLGDPVGINLRATDFSDLTFGGDLTLTFDQNVIGYNNSIFVAPLDVLSNVDESQAGNGVIEFSFGVFPAQGGDSLLTTLNFTATAEGTSLIELTIPQWAGAGVGDVIDVTPVNGVVTVVPIPGAMWLLGSALFAVFTFVRNRGRVVP